jgi:hypothetical protein
MSATVKLRAGALDGAGTLTPGSMARAIEDALAALVPLAKHEDPLLRRKLVLAVAQGVISHLKANETAFVALHPDGSGGTYDLAVRIDVG